ncbi:MAG: type III pantothenate kinase [Flammeovirgaceae bacterium]
MNIVIDAGNTRTKVGIFEGDTFLQKHSFTLLSELISFLEKQSFANALVSSVGMAANEIGEHVRASSKCLTLSHTTALPVKILYETPHTLGVDRVAAVCGALALFPNRNCLVIDVGTCITYDWLDGQGNYHGGGISPGLDMRLKAMHTFTARLPMVSVDPSIGLVGKSTQHCLQSGAWHGMLAEIEGVIGRYHEMSPLLQVVLCGGDARLFENKLKHTIFAAPDLVLNGLNRILLHNAD